MRHNQDHWATGSPRPVQAHGQSCHRRLVLLGLPALALAGCAATPGERLEGGLYCAVAGKRGTRTCTTAPIPPVSVQSEVKHFAPVADAFTLVIVRSRWADPINRVDVLLDGKPLVATVPGSFVHVLLPGGRHTLAFEWEGRASHITVGGAPGTLGFAELVGSSWFWSSRYRWSVRHAEGASLRAKASTLIASVDRRG